MYKIVGVFEGFMMDRREALRAGHYLISLLALKFVLLCLKLVEREWEMVSCRQHKPARRGGACPTILSVFVSS